MIKETTKSTQITQEEDQEIKNLQDLYNQRVYEIGLLHLARLDLESKLKAINEEISGNVIDIGNYTIKEKELIAKLESKYGTSGWAPL